MRTLFYVSSGAILLRYLVLHRISSFLPSREMNHPLKLLHASWVTGFAFLRLCFRHHMYIFFSPRSLHLNTFIAFCGSIDSTPDKKILDIVIGDKFAEEKTRATEIFHCPERCLGRTWGVMSMLHGLIQDLSTERPLVNLGRLIQDKLNCGCWSPDSWAPEMKVCGPCYLWLLPQSSACPVLA